jgi:steroid delta-isomerase-like uncharacterized protein
MIAPHPDMIPVVAAELRKDLLATAARERRTDSGSPSMWDRLLQPASFLVPGLIFALLALLAVSAVDVGAQESSLVAGELPRVAVAFAEAWSCGDPDKLIAIYSEDAIFEEVILGAAPIQGREALAAYAAAVYAAFPDFTATPVRGFASGNEAVLEWILSGTYEGTFGTLPPGAGQHVEVRVATVVELTENGLIAHDREYWDLATLLTQVGALPGVEDEGTSEP